MPYLVVPSVSAAPALKKRALSVLVAIAVVVQTFLVIWFSSRTNAFSLLAASSTEEEYLRKQRSTYPTIEWLNLQLPTDSRTLLVGHGETYWFTRRVRGGGNFDGPRVSSYLEAASPDLLREKLRHDGITHIAIVTPPHRHHRREQTRRTPDHPLPRRPANPRPNPRPLRVRT